MSGATNEILDRLNRQSKEVDSIYYNIASCLSLSENAFWVLYILSDSERDYSQQDICDEWLFSKQTVNSTVKGLTAKRYVYFEQRSHSKRKKVLKLTKAGAAFVQENMMAVRQAEINALSRMTKKNG